MPPRSAIVVGSISRDFVVEGVPDSSRPGGVAYYAGRALVRMGLRTRIITRLQSSDAPNLLAPLRAEGVEILALDSHETTSYLNAYGGAQDRHELLATSDPLRANDLPADWRSADLIQLGPLHRRDLLPEVAASFNGLRGLDLQGLIRVQRREGTALEPNPQLGAFLAHTEVVQVSEQELPPVLDGDTLDAFIRRHALRELIVTRGARGASIFCEGRRWNLAPPVIVKGSPIGAGDVFLGAYLMLRIEGRDPEGAARGAARASVTQIERGELPEGFSVEEEA